MLTKLMPPSIQERKQAPISMASTILLAAVLILHAIATTLSITDNINSTDSALLQSLGTSLQATHFASFARRYGKNYKSVQEISKRFGIFAENLELIESSNRKGLSYALEINQFADLTWEEFKASRLGVSQNCSTTIRGNHYMLAEEKLPKTKDWRKDGIVSRVKNQLLCGSCWSFSATGALEAAYTKLTGKTISLSEQQLIDCAKAFNNFGCGGGLPSQAFEYIKHSGGLETEETYPYMAFDGECSYNKKNVGVKVIESVNISLGAEDELKHAVGIVGPVSVAFDAIPSFMFYKSGIYSTDKCRNSSKDLNHAVLAVGYGIEKGVPYWLIKNSWGRKWGDGGYFKMELGKNMCGVATCASYPIVAA